MDNNNIKEFNVRIQSKYDTYTNWTKEENNPVLLEGEVAYTVVKIEEKTSSGVMQVPTIMAKVGDGETPYNELPFLGAVAADVYDWAKAESKPEYTATEINGLKDYISEKIKDTNTKYQIVSVDLADGKKGYKLQKQDIGEEDWDDVENSIIEIPVDADLTERVEALEGKLELGEYNTVEAYVKAIADPLSAAISTLVGEEEGDADKSVREISAEEVAKIVAGAPESYDTLQEIAAWIQAHPGDVATMNKAITELQTKVQLGEYQEDGETKEYGTVRAYVEAVIAALKNQIGIGDSASGEVTIASRLDAVEEDIGVPTDEENSISATGLFKRVEDLENSEVNIDDVTQTEQTYFVLKCGSAEKNI